MNKMPKVAPVMSQPRVVRASLAVLLTVVFAIVFVVLLTLACSRTADRRAQVEKMLAAHNRHDVTGELSVFTEDAAFVIAGQAPITGKLALRNLFQADSVMNSERIYRGITARRDTLFIDSLTERNDVLRLLGLSSMSYTPGTRIIFRGSLIQEIDLTPPDPKQFTAMQTAFRELMVWVQKAHPELLQEIRSGWLSGNTARSAEGWIKLATEWRESRAKPEE